eukprot:1159068-Pelagomonas_calceolata.AAC.2
MSAEPPPPTACVRANMCVPSFVLLLYVVELCVKDCRQLQLPLLPAEPPCSLCEGKHMCTQFRFAALRGGVVLRTAGNCSCPCCLQAPLQPVAESRPVEVEAVCGLPLPAACTLAHCMDLWDPPYSAVYGASTRPSYRRPSSEKNGHCSDEGPAVLRRSLSSGTESGR